jgi:hypothetical protein
MQEKVAQGDRLTRLRSSRLGLVAIVLAGVLGGIASTTEAVDKIAIWVGIRPNALQLARDHEKAQFSRELTKAAWSRLFLMRRYLLGAKNNYGEAQREKEWERYLTALDEWNRDLMVNILSLQQLYGTSKRREFEERIQPAFGHLHDCLEALRHPSSDWQCPLSATRDIAAIEKGMDRLNAQLYCFVSGLPEKGAEC